MQKATDSGLVHRCAPRIRRTSSAFHLTEFEPVVVACPCSRLVSIRKRKAFKRWIGRGAWLARTGTPATIGFGRTRGGTETAVQESGDENQGYYANEEHGQRGQSSLEVRCTSGQNEDHAMGR